ncbi:MAG TPA: VWA domain-containing protein [Clostridia bacterium]|nr:VWA domain-containing protein [Clostridia bacterium]
MTRRIRDGCGSGFTKHPLAVYIPGISGAASIRVSPWLGCACAAVLMTAMAAAQTVASSATQPASPPTGTAQTASSNSQQGPTPSVGPSQAGSSQRQTGSAQPDATPPGVPGKQGQNGGLVTGESGKKKELAPGSNFEEVHIEPRIEPPKPTKAMADVLSPASTDPSLKTHTKPMKVDVDLVLVPVTVTDPMNRLVTGLEQENFVVTDAGEKQEVRHFSSEDAPISLGVIFDMSGSMKDKIEKAREAVVEFFKTANPDDEFFMIGFSDKPDVIADFTQSIEEIQGRLVYTLPKGRTALMDAIYLGLAKMRDARHQKRAMLILSDGGDNHSRYTENEIKSLVKEADVQIYAIGMFSFNPQSPEEQMGPSTLAQITDVTGGRTFTIDNPNELSDVATKIGIELRNQYVLGYRPSKPARDGKWRKIKVKLVPPRGLPPLTVYAKTGYYAPTE